MIRVRPVTGFHLSAVNLADTGDLIRTCVIEAVLAAVTVSAARRRYRRTRRTA